MMQYANLYRGTLHYKWRLGLNQQNGQWTGCTHSRLWVEIIKHLLDRTLPNIVFIWSGKVILGLGFASVGYRFQNSGISGPIFVVV